jgi:hypothetical protein
MRKPGERRAATPMHKQLLAIRSLTIAPTSVGLCQGRQVNATVAATSGVFLPRVGREEASFFTTAMEISL